tara:strand:+ start:389 stop:634 length:246 start_codon:yes stop_codon:yes gene_type:complete
MTKGYIYGKPELAKTKTKAKPKQRISDDVINQDEVEYNKLQNKIFDDKIHDVYFKAHETLSKRVGLIVEGAMKKHKQEEEL